MAWQQLNKKSSNRRSFTTGKPTSSAHWTIGGVQLEMLGLCETNGITTTSNFILCELQGSWSLQPGLKNSRHPLHQQLGKQTLLKAEIWIDISIAATVNCPQSWKELCIGVLNPRSAQHVRRSMMSIEIPGIIHWSPGFITKHTSASRRRSAEQHPSPPKCMIRFVATFLKTYSIWSVSLHPSRDKSQLMKKTSETAESASKELPYDFLQPSISKASAWTVFGYLWRRHPHLPNDPGIVRSHPLV